MSCGVRTSVLVLVLVHVLDRSAGADPERIVALLPLDAPAQLEIYGQPVASEIARALGAAQIDVVVVGRHAAVPADALLIVDGTIAQKGDQIYLALRVRRRVDGVVLDDSVKANQPLANLDRAASELSAQLLPIVKLKLAVAPKPPPDVDRGPSDHPKPPPAAGPRPLLVAAIASTGTASAEVEPLRAALVDATGAWAAAHDRVVKPADGAQLSAKLATATIAHSHVDLAIAFEVAGYTTAVEAGVPVARARVRVRIADAQLVLFDRVVVTDSVVGDKATPPAALAARTASEVLAILRPSLRKIGGWR